ncbi:FG-GAP repeat domain-containing protein [Streptomyces sp. NPDC050504]|uniref:FG-GAP repeat domain-containing protein n=1 Tax=Streptomyces sp. NPDC050504 TaxID=3365618 RepID=UPI0037B5A0E7
MSTTRRQRALKRTLVTTAITAALATTAGTAVADSAPANADASRTRAEVQSGQSAHGAALASPRTAAAALPLTPTYPMLAVHKKNKNAYLFFPNDRGGFERAYNVGVPYDFAAAVAQADHNGDGIGDGSWDYQKDGLVTYSWEKPNGDFDTKLVGSGWKHRKFLSPGDLGGSKAADILAVDKAGNAYVYCGYPDGRLTRPTRVATGWNAYTEIAGLGDLTGDGKADVVVRNKTGDLFLLAGTGSYTKPFKPGKKIGAGWNGYDRILSVGDLDGDGITDLIARTKTGDLYRYSGTGRATAPIRKLVKIGTGFNAYNLL